MRRLVLRRIPVFAACVTIFACSDSLSPEDFYGTWGTEGARLILSESQAQFQSSCWAGELAIPLQFDGDEFEANGTVTSQGGAGQPETRLATFHGRLDGDRIGLTVAPATLGLGPYTLIRGEEGSIPGCP